MKNKKPQPPPKKSAGVLSGYKKVGKSFIPPFVHSIGPTKNSSFILTTLPELIWIDVLNWKLGEVRAADVSVAISERMPKICDRPETWWCFASSYSLLTDMQKKEFVSSLDKKTLDTLRWALCDFYFYYPEFPLKFLFPSPPPTVIDKEFLSEFKKRLDEVSFKRSRPAVLMQAIPVYMGFTQDRLKVAEGLALADFPEVEKYPDTQRSKEVGASICATVNMLVASQVIDLNLNDWSKYFWNRGIELEPIDFRFLDELEDANGSI